MVTAEYFPRELVKEADFQSQNVKDSSEWKLSSIAFQEMCHQWEPQIWNALDLEYVAKFQPTYFGN